ncbi:hypothetical protein OB2597_01577 [Pseudooceanicola batsensis HTCC2597]|uniref:Uncharacterized protein n=1 Tax=Pseudooceanicola batsensis (strain ATCC BAA-863 / DSM 15984 / KCTC 12145 / HTCC2597) TaxID=252305 RepID=A3U308_PSEBH|nr:DUF892 family protein [Pseudooceanicola batsensis]EAQ01538.1 hypothetical protein OB2597_01577 [Pseudooceanicola batsensis HTCC2597]
MQTDSLKALYFTELQEAASFEAQFAEALPRFAEKANDPSLREVLSDDMPAARRHAQQLSGLLEMHEVADRGHTDGSMRAILREALDWVEDIADPAVRDAALIASVQRILHYGMAVHGSLAGWARQLDLADRETLEAAVEEARGADARLTEIAQGKVNAEAA